VEAPRKLDLNRSSRVRISELRSRVIRVDPRKSAAKILRGLVLEVEIPSAKTNEAKASHLDRIVRGFLRCLVTAWWRMTASARQRSRSHEQAAPHLPKPVAHS
jgi:hypothetical protein